MMPIRAKTRCRAAGIDTRAMADAVDVLALRSVGCLPTVDYGGRLRVDNARFCCPQAPALALLAGGLSIWTASTR